MAGKESIPDDVDTIEDPVCNICLVKSDYIEIYGSIYRSVYYERNPLNMSEFRFKDNRKRVEFYNLALSKKLIRSYEETCIGDD